MTTYVASLHLPYTVIFNKDDPHTPPRYSSKRNTPPDSPSRNNHPTLGPAGRLPQLSSKSAKTPFEQPTPIPNLLQALGREPVSTPPLSAGHNTPPPSAEEIFFRNNIAANAPLGSPSDPSVVPRKALLPKLALKKATNSLNGTVEGQMGYFDLPNGKPITHREKRRSSASSSRSLKEPWSVVWTEQGNGGLKNAVAAAQGRGQLEDAVWVGCLGVATDGLDESTKVAIEGDLRENHDCIVTWTKDKDYNGHYDHFCKEILWPVFHYQIPDHPKSKAFLDHSWKYFEAVNRAVADAIIKDFKRGDSIWVNDYHLILVPSMLREALGPDAKIGFFLHVGFPSSEVFRCLAHRERLLKGILGATMIGFQTEEYARHFLQTVSRLLCMEVTTKGVVKDDRFVDVISLPIGIDPEQLTEKRNEAEVEEWIDMLKERYADMKLLVARDKLDGVRGVRQKLLAYELFLKKHPEWVGKVVLIQVALSTTSSIELLSTVTDIVTRINCDFGTLEYQPVVYLHQDITYHQYIALLTIADALVVTSLRDGMNLTSHEFIFMQDKKNSPLILSEFTGSAAVLCGAEISVNPWDHSRCAEAIHKALVMPEVEKKQRWEKLYKSITHQTAGYWLTTFLGKLTEFWENQQRTGSIMIPRLNTRKLAACYTKANSRIFLLDYEGTLASWGSPGSEIMASPQRTLDALNDLILDPKNRVYVMSSRPPEELDSLFHRVPDLGLIAENGCFVRPYGREAWERLADEELEWKSSVKEILSYYIERTPGSYIEERNCSFIWHTEKAEDPVFASRQSGDCCSHVNESCGQWNVTAVPMEKAVLVESKNWDKVSASQHVLGLCEDKVEWLMVAGDGREDEPLFAWADKLKDEKGFASVTTVKVGSKHTCAKHTTTGVAGIIAALQKLANISLEDCSDKE